MLAIAGLGLQAELWLSDDGYRKTLKLRTAVAEQRASTNRCATATRRSMPKSSISSKGRDAAEERARTDLGMIGEQETFYQVVPVADASH